MAYIDKVRVSHALEKHLQGLKITQGGRASISHYYLDISESANLSTRLKKTFVLSSGILQTKLTAIKGVTPCNDYSNYFRKVWCSCKLSTSKTYLLKNFKKSSFKSLKQLSFVIISCGQKNFTW